MGYYTTIYITAGIRIIAPTEIAMVKERTCGCNKKHHDDKEVKYCSSCGNMIKTVHVEQETTIHPEDLLGHGNLAYEWINEPDGDGDGDGDEDKKIVEYLYLTSYKSSNLVEQGTFKKIDSDLITRLKQEFIADHFDDLQVIQDKINKTVTIECFVRYNYR